MPPLAAAPSDFSRIVVSPPALLPGEGLLFISPPLIAAVLLPPLDALDQLLADLARDRAARQQVLGAVDLGRLRQDRGAAVAHQEVGAGAERRVRGHAGIGVRAAALQRQRDLRGRDRLAPRRVGVRQHLADHRLRALDRLAGAAGALHGHGAEMRPALDLVGLEQEVDLVDLAAEPDHQHAGEVGMAGVAPERALQGREALAAIGHAAAGAMGQRDDAIDVADRPRARPRGKVSAT